MPVLRQVLSEDLLDIGELNNDDDDLEIAEVGPGMCRSLLISFKALKLPLRPGLSMSLSCVEACSSAPRVMV